MIYRYFPEICRENLTLDRQFIPNTTGTANNYPRVAIGAGVSRHQEGMLDFPISIASGINLKSGDRINRQEFSQNEREIDDNTTVPPYS